MLQGFPSEDIDVCFSFQRYSKFDFKNNEDQLLNSERYIVCQNRIPRDQ